MYTTRCKQTAGQEILAWDNYNLKEGILYRKATVNGEELEQLVLPSSWICPKCEFFNFSDSFFGEQVNLETENRFVPLTKEKKDRSSPYGTNKSSFISGLKFISMNINSIRGKKLELLAFLDFHQPHVVAIQETKIDSSIATSELFPETCPYSVYRKDRNIHVGGVMLLVHKDISIFAYHRTGKRLGINLGESVCKQNFSFCGKLLSTAW